MRFIREIKFKAINSVNNEVMEVENIDYREEGIIVFVKCDDWKTRQGFWVGLDCELMQYTGLKDKNGKDIYEGDIICTPKGNYQIVWGTDIACFEGVTRIGSRSLYGIIQTFKEYVEVIGNIYENGDLLGT